MDYLTKLITRYPALDTIKAEIETAYGLMADCFQNGRKLLIAGNGGSAADADHIVGELMKAFLKCRKIDNAFSQRLIAANAERGKILAEQLQIPLSAIALTHHTAFSTAFANDMNADLVFAQQLYGYGKPGDVFLAISTSGNSRNLLYAVTVAKALDIKIVVLTGADGGKLGQEADVAVRVPETEAFVVQELHMPVYHCWCAMLEDAMKWEL